MCGEKTGCQKPEELKGDPSQCSPEQIRKCHGDSGEHPCAATGECEQPSNLQGRPQNCSPEQIRKCHGDGGGHPCTAEE